VAAVRWHLFCDIGDEMGCERHGGRRVRRGRRYVVAAARMPASGAFIPPVYRSLDSCVILCSVNDDNPNSGT